MTGIHFHNYLRVVAVVAQIFGKTITGYFENVYDMSIPDPKNKQNKYISMRLYATVVPHRTV